MNTKNIYNKQNNIFQSPIWAEFQETVGREALEIDGSYYFKERLFRNKYFLFCPKGPIGKIPNNKSQITNKFQNPNIQNLVFARIETSGADSSQFCSNDNFRKVTKNSILSQQHSPEQTLVLDLTKSEEELLKNMKSKHRYNIRLASKKGVVIKKGTSQKEVADFYKLSLEVSERDKTFAPHPKSYYEKMAEVLGKNNNLQIFTAKYRSKPLSSIIILFYGDTTIYLHGASSSKYRNLMPNHLAQWEAIKEAKKKGCKYYDFWGVAVRQKLFNSVVPNMIGDSRKEEIDSRLRGNDKDETGDDKKGEGNDKKGEGSDSEWSIDEKHTWVGITKFKLGFVKLGITGKVVEFSGAYDLPISKIWYDGLSTINKLRKLIRK